MGKFFTHIRSLLIWMRSAITQPRDELDRWEAALRFTYDLGRFGAMQLRYDRAPQMAAALAFRTLFSMLPVFVVSTVLVNAFKGETEFMEMLTRLFRELGLYEITSSAEQVLDDGNLSGTQTLGSWLEDLVRQASGMNLSAIGWVGLGVLLYSAISLMATIEKSFNVVFRVEEGRHWAQRIPTYFTTLLGWPIAVAIIMYVDRTLESKLDDLGVWTWVMSLAPALWSFIAIWLVMSVVYLLVPNTDVKVRPSMIGALVASILLGLGWGTMSAYLENALSIQHLYGSLGLIPLFMFWVYLMWLVILFGLEVSASLQMLGGRRMEEMRAQQRSERGLFDPALVLSVMEVVGSDFAAGQTTSVSSLGSALQIPDSVARRIAEALVESGYLHQVSGGEAGYAPARPLGSMDASAVLRVGFSLMASGSGGESVTIQEGLRQAQIERLQGLTIAEIVSKSENLSASDKEGH